MVSGIPNLIEMETTNNEKVILWQNKEELSQERNPHSTAASSLNAIMRALEARGVVPSTEILRDICEEGALLRETFTTLLQAEVDKFDLPYLKEATLKHLPGILSEANEFVYKVKEILRTGWGMKGSSFSCNENGYVVFDEQSIIDKYTVYVDNEAREKAKAMADELISKITEFNDYVKLVSEGRAKGFGSAILHSSVSMREPLIRVYADENKDPEIDGKAFRHIHLK